MSKKAETVVWQLCDSPYHSGVKKSLFGSFAGFFDRGLGKNSLYEANDQKCSLSRIVEMDQPHQNSPSKPSDGQPDECLLQTDFLGRS